MQGPRRTRRRGGEACKAEEEEGGWEERRRESKGGLVHGLVKDKWKKGKGLTRRGVCFIGNQTEFHIAHVNIQAGLHVPSKMFTRRSACVHTQRGNKMVCPCAGLHAFILACDRHKTGQRASAETDSSQCLQQAQSSQGNVYSLLAVPERRWHQSIPFWQGSWDNSRLWFPAITPANQNERHRDCREPQECVCVRWGGSLQYATASQR